MRRTYLLLLLASTALAEAPGELRSCSTETEFAYPKYKSSVTQQSRVAIEKGLRERVDSLGYPPFSARAVASAAAELTVKNYTKQNWLSITRLDCKGERPGIGQYYGVAADGKVCDERLTPTEIQQLAQEAQKRCGEVIASLQNSHRNNDFFRIECPEPSLKVERVPCKTEGCDEKQLAKVIRIEAWPRFVLTNVGPDPHARERRCLAVRSCVAKLKSLPESVEEELALRGEVYCRAHEREGLDGIAKVLRQRGVKFASEKGAGDRPPAGQASTGAAE